MLHLQPLSEEKANSQIQLLYQDIRHVLGVAVVPLIFQYMGNFDEYLSFMWEHLRANVESSQFESSALQLMQFSEDAASVIYQPSVPILEFVNGLGEKERHEIAKTAAMLYTTNVTLLLFSLGIRESIKGVWAQVDLLKGVTQEKPDTLFSELMSMSSDSNTWSKEEVSAIGSMLVPLFGAGALQVVNYPSFFTRVSFEMEKLIATEAYLKTRVELERISLLLLPTLPYPLATSFQKFMELTKNSPHAYELLYLLKDVFPSQFPRLVLTSSVMKRSLRSELGLRRV